MSTPFCRLFCICALLLLLCNPVLAQTYTFDNDTQGWGTNADGSPPIWEATGGNPGGWISAYDISTGGTWHWIAPAEVLGNACGAYGLELSFDLKTSQQVTNTAKADVVLVGDGIEIVYNLEYDPYTFWTPFEVVLKEDAGWRVGTVFGSVPTKEQFIAVLQNLEELRIRGEYLQQAVDYGGLDNVVLGTTTFEFDLDKNDSTTPPNSKNYVNDTSCTDVAHICDLDLRLVSESPIDSIVILIVSPSDGVAEYLEYLGQVAAGGPTMAGAGTKCIVLKNAGQTLASGYREVLQQINYRNNKARPTPGMRQIWVAVYTSCGPLGQGYAYVPLFPPAYAGDDGMADFCPGAPPSNLLSYIGGDFDAGGYWTPAFVDSALVFDPQLDTLRQFNYVVPSIWSGCPPDSAMVVVRVATAFPDLGKDTVLCRDKSLKLSIPLLPEYASIAWSTGASSGSIKINEAGEYAVTVTSEVGNCQFSDTVRVEYVNCVPCNIYVPNVFAPDNDGENDWFQGYSDCDFLSYHLRVFDRWGNMLFQSRSVENHWDGNFRDRAMSPGVFIWLLDVETEYLGKAVAQRLQGDVTIVK